MKDKMKAKLALIRSFPNRSPSGLPVYVAVPQNAPFGSEWLILFSLGFGSHHLREANRNKNNQWPEKS